MGNADLIITIKGNYMYTFLIKGTDYRTYQEAIIKALDLSDASYNNLFQQAIYPHELPPKEITDIEIRELTKEQ